MGCPVIIVTSNLSGPYNDMPHLETWTLQLLKKYNIDLAQGMLADKSFVINNMTKVKETYPTFHKGLLSCNQEDRINPYHQVLSTLLAGIKFLPDTVIMIQNNINDLNAAAIQFKLISKNIEVLGFQYVPPPAGLSKLSPNEYLAFMTKLVEKTNSVKRALSKIEQDDPYEE